MQVEIEGIATVVAILNILIDYNKPVSMWVHVAVGTDAAAADNDCCRWVCVRHLPSQVDNVSFPVWAYAFELENAADVTDDYLDNKPSMADAWSNAFAKASLVAAAAMVPPTPAPAST